MSNFDEDVSFKKVFKATLNLSPWKVIFILSCYVTNIVCLNYAVGKGVGELEYLSWMICAAIILSQPFLAVDRAHLLALDEQFKLANTHIQGSVSVSQKSTFKNKANRRLIASCLVAFVSILTTQFTIMTLRDESIIGSVRTTPLYEAKAEVLAELKKPNL